MADGTAKTVLRWTVDVIGLYRECQSRQARLIEAVDTRQGLND